MVFIAIESRVYKITDKECELLTQLANEACKSSEGEMEFYKALEKIECNNKIKTLLNEVFRYP